MAEDLNIQKKWAIKQIFSGNMMGRKLASHEVDMMKQIDYPLFPRIVDSWQEKDSYFIVSDYIKGRSLYSILKQRRIPKRTAIGWSIELAKALDYLHNQEPPILYLDLKPENIMVRPDGTICLIDFGIAKSIVEASYPLGTPGYAAPEQYDADKNSVSPSTDVYALGMTMYVMLTSLFPCNDSITQYQRVKDDYSLPSKLKRIILKCINSNPKRRYSTARDLLIILNHFGDKYHERKIKLVLGIVFSLMVPLCLVINSKYEHILLQKQAGMELMEQISSMQINGHYDGRAVKIIRGYLDSGSLNYELSNQLTIDVAFFYFFEKRDYKEALRFYKKVDVSEYPYVNYFISLCNLQKGFEKDINKRNECLSQFLKYNREMSLCYEKIDNYILISMCYEQDSGICVDSCLMAKECLVEALDVLEGAEKGNDLSMSEYDNLKSEIERRKKLIEDQIVLMEGDLE